MPHDHCSDSPSSGGGLPAANTLVDNFSRRITYLRLSITDRCDLRCRYCCPEDGIPLVPHDEVLSYEEMVRLVALFASVGVKKIRLTGGEPFARKGALGFIARLKRLEGVEQLYITTNGVQAGRHLDALVDAGVDGLNLSLDTLDAGRYKEITRRDRLAEVLQTLHGALERKIPLKVNSVILEDTRDEEIESMVELARENPLTVRFIEQMPFSGAESLQVRRRPPLDVRLKKLRPEMVEETSDLPSTARVFSLPGYRGKIGIIEGNSRHFCKTCNKVRVTAVGMLKTCLYDNGSLDLRALLRSGIADEEIIARIRASVRNSAADGHAAESGCNRVSEPSMAGIGG